MVPSISSTHPNLQEIPPALPLASSRIGVNTAVRSDKNPFAVVFITQISLDPSFISGTAEPWQKFLPKPHIHLNEQFLG